MKVRTYQEMTDHIIDQIRRMQISLDDKMSLVGMLTALQTRHEMDISNATKTEEALEKRCPFCGGHLSEVRMDADGKEYRYCYGCFHEYEVNDNA